MKAISFQSSLFGHAVGHTFRFVFQNFRSILGRLWLPLIGGWLVMYVSLDRYFFWLMQFVPSPTQREASFLLAFAAAGTLAVLFLHSIIRGSLTALALEQETGARPLHLQLGRREWRIYAANLRLLLLLIVVVVAVQAAGQLLANVPAGRGGGVALAIGTPAQLLTAVLFAGLGIRLMFLSPSVASCEQGPILRRAFRLSAGRSLLLLAVGIVMVLPGLGIEFAGEYVTQSLFGIPVAHGEPLMAFSAYFRNVLLPFMVVLGLAYAVTVVLLTVSGAIVYRALVTPPS